MFNTSAQFAAARLTSPSSPAVTTSESISWDSRLAFWIKDGIDRASRRAYRLPQ
jgi:hypothetical protein